MQMHTRVCQGARPQLFLRPSYMAWLPLRATHGGDSEAQLSCSLQGRCRMVTSSQANTECVARRDKEQRATPGRPVVDRRALESPISAGSEPGPFAALSPDYASVRQQWSWHLVARKRLCEHFESKRTHAPEVSRSQVATAKQQARPSAR